MTDRPPLLTDAALDHVEVFVPDRAAAAAWYRYVLGLAPVDKWSYWATPRGPLMLAPGGAVPAGGSMIALFERTPCAARGLGEHHRVAVRTGGEAFLRFVAHAAEAELFDETGAPLPGVTPVDHDGAFSVYFCDPWGNRCEVTTYDWHLVAAAR